MEPQTLELAADADLLDQALINLMLDAIEALGDIAAGRIALSARRHPDGRVVIAVADNGPGIAPDRHGSWCDGRRCADPGRGRDGQLEVLTVGRIT